MIPPPLPLLPICPSLRRNFFVFTKFSYLQPFREIMGDKKNVNFWLKKSLQPKKMSFFRLFFCCIYSRQDQTFLFLTKFHIFTVQKSHGGTRRSVISTTTTTNYVCVIIPCQDSFRILVLMIYYGTINISIIQMALL